MSSRIDDNGRECTGCKTYKPWGCFSKGLDHGHCNRCRECTAAYRQTDAYRERNRLRQAAKLAIPEERDKQNERMREYNARPDVIERRKQEKALEPKVRIFSRVDDNGRECVVCKQYKPWAEYNKGICHGHDARCKECLQAYRRSPGYRERNMMRGRVRFDDPIEREKQNERMRAYYDRPDVIAKMKTEEFLKAAAERAREWNKNRDWTPEQIAHRRELGRKNMRKFLSNPRNRLSNRMAAGVKRLLRGQKNGRPWETLVGYTIDDLRSHLEKLFEPGMTWENYGKNGWHVDHIRPMTAFVFVSYEDPEFRLCWSLDNLMPRWCTTAIAIAHGSKSVGNINKGGSFKFYRQ